MKKKQHVPSKMRMTMKPTTGTATTRPRFTPLEEGVVVERDIEEGRSVSVKIRVGEMSNAEPMVVL
jgi:predicted ATP-grasp superfamily ATP-dependent carboligase